jgi:formylglycine-generating enzyme required for sulfatase activity
VTPADLTLPSAIAAGVIQLGLAAADLASDGCPVTGNGCTDVYAVSIARVTPAAFINWFQAAAAARNSHKRLPTNAEWQAAALGTPDTGGADNGLTTCNTDNLAPGVTPTGSRSSCVSDVGAFDMVGNLNEWVADWVPRSTACPGWGSFSDDFMCLAGADETSGPGALIRGGNRLFGAVAGVFAVLAGRMPSEANNVIGFRAAR